MMVSEIKLVTVGVADLHRSVSFYRQGFGLVELDRGRATDENRRTLWRLPSGMGAEYAILGLAGRLSGMLRLLQCEAPGEPIWGDYARLQDLGHYALNFRVRDIQVAWPRLLAAGAREKSAPHYWRVNADIAAWDSMSYDPDGVLLDVFEVQGNISSTLGILTTDSSEVQTMAIHVADAGRSKAFYTGLGYEVLYDKVVEKMEGFFGLPRGVKLHNINLIRPGQFPNGRIEIVQYIGFPGESLREKAIPPNRGLLAISFETTDLTETMSRLENTGATRIAGPVEADYGFLGPVVAATFAGPDGETLEFFQTDPDSQS